MERNPAVADIIFDAVFKHQNRFGDKLIDEGTYTKLMGNPNTAGIFRKVIDDLKSEHLSHQQTNGLSKDELDQDYKNDFFKELQKEKSPEYNTRVKANQEIVQPLRAQYEKLTKKLIEEKDKLTEEQFKSISKQRDEVKVNYDREVDNIQKGRWKIDDDGELIKRDAEDGIKLNLSETDLKHVFNIEGNTDYREEVKAKSYTDTKNNI